MARLVAHHSEARFEIRLRGFSDELAAYEPEDLWVSDALTHCDLTTGPAGQSMELEDRIAEVEQRYGRARSSMRCDRPRRFPWMPSNGQRTGSGDTPCGLRQAMTARGLCSR